MDAVLFVKTGLDALSGYENIAFGNAPTFQVKNSVLLIGNVSFFGLILEMVLACLVLVGLLFLDFYYDIQVNRKV